MFGKIAQFVEAPSIAVDLGTANTRIYAFGIGTFLEKPSSVSLVKGKNSEISDEYFKYINSTLVAAPLRGGVIVDLKNAVTLLKPLIVKTRRLLKSPVSLACAPTDTSEVERGLLCRALIASGASRVAIIPEVWAAAVGAGVDITLPTAQMLIDIGEGVTDLAVFREGRIIFSSAIRTACGDIHKAVRSSVMARYKIKIYEQEIERLTNEIAAIVGEPGRNGLLHLAGIDVVKRTEIRTMVDSRIIVDAVLPVFNRITDMIETSLTKLPEKIYCDILDSGIYLTGGGACIEGMDGLIAATTRMTIKIAPDPLHAVINGATQTLNYWHGKKCWWDNIVWPKIPT